MLCDRLPEAVLCCCCVFVLQIEYHHRLSVAEAASFCQKLPPGTLDWFEEAIRDESPEAYETLRTLTPQPFAIGEEFVCPTFAAAATPPQGNEAHIDSSLVH